MPAPKSFVTRWLLLTLCLMALGLGTSACGGESPWDLSPSTNSQCDIYKQLRDNPAYTKASAYDNPAKAAEYKQKEGLRSPYSTLMAQGQERGCLVLYRESANKLSVIKLAAVALTDQGELKALNAQTKQYDGPIRWKLSPTQLKGVAMNMELLVLRPEQVEKKDHAKLCQEILQTKPQCFPDDATQASDCWFWMKLSPQLSKETPFQVTGTAGTCRLCSREICGNKIDDDCDGQTDEGCGESDCHHPGATLPCYEGPKGTENIGLCQAGVRTCRKSSDEKNKGALQWSACEKQSVPQKEVCNGIDDNCDGQTDENLKDCCVVGEVRACYSGDSKFAGKGICSRGVEQCNYDEASKGGKWSACQGDTQPGQESCNGKDDDCNGKIDDGLPVKDCQTQQPGECAAGQQACVNGRNKCRPKKEPQQELCNLRDDDCDGSVDELFQERGQPCKVAGKVGPCEKGIKLSCVQGQVVCQALYKADTVELCNDGIDNDCNGKTDEQDPKCECKAGQKQKCYPGPAGTKNVGLCKEGEQTCQLSGKWGPCEGAALPQTEVCDGKDNNCDGKVDEDFPTKGQLCFIVTGGAQGPCSYGRLQKCGQAPTFKAECVAVFKAKSAEICNNGIDDDCDGVIDNSPPCDCRKKSANTQACSKMPPSLWNQGICKTGTQTCNFNGVWSGCLNETPPALEVCDGKDNDCNGKVDDNDPKLNTACQVQSNSGVCKAGTNRCQSGKITCVAKIKTPPKADLCNGKDDDCNGKIDDSDPLSKTVCNDPSKQGECSRGQLTCSQGKWTCPSTVTSKAEECNGKDDDCNGKIDDNLTAPSCKSSRQGVCAQATKLCGGIKGWLECQPGDFFRISALYQEEETLCDGKDNDCDGQVDVDPNGKALTRPCYDNADGKPGPKEARGVGSCKDGVSTCNNGQWSKCNNAVFPTLPQCDTNDKNCNGTVDKDEPACRCFEKQAQGELVIRTWGNGKDGSITVKSKLLLDKVAGKDLDRSTTSSRSQPDLTYHKVTAIGEQHIEVQDASGLSEGDEILLLHLQGDAKRAGSYELLRINTLEKTKLNFTTKVTGTYGSQDNTSLQDQTILAVRVPQYRKVQITGEGSLTVSPWNGSSGGILVFRAQELVQVGFGGSLSVNGTGYRGGASVQGNSAEAKAGESIQGQATDGTGKNGAGSASAKGTNAASGGGGGYGSDGTNGSLQDGKPAGTPGKTYGKASLQQNIYLGSGGGAGAPDSGAKGSDSNNATGAGGSGGGLLLVIARTINVAGTVSADGNPGGNAQSFGATLGGGGGGSGGSVHLRAYNLQLYPSARLSAAGGKGGQSASDGPSNPKQPVEKSLGGNGGNGRVDIRLIQLNGKAAKADPKTLASWATTPTPKLDTILQQCIPPAVVPQ